MREIWCKINEAPKKDTEVSLAELCMKHRREGIREVVEWLEEHRHQDLATTYHRFVITVDEWQAKLKEWGLDENRTAEDNQETG